MSSIAISVKQLCKKFRISHSAHGSFKNLLVRRVRTPQNWLNALDDVTFDVSKGECVSVIGKNGAGKSTLLGVLARVYKPTSGEIKLEGRVAPLLELGAGFHPDLTGSENVYFNGVVLGLTRKQVEQRMDEIVAFSEIGGYIDVPVRTYSSGMILRLGFSVAMHVDASILLVDEALAVGDIEFQKKCLERIEDFKRQGGAILFVSHDMTAVRKTADRVIWMKEGKIFKQGATDEILPMFESSAELDQI